MDNLKAADITDSAKKIQAALFSLGATLDQLANGAASPLKHQLVTCATACEAIGLIAASIEENLV